MTRRLPPQSQPRFTAADCIAALHAHARGGVICTETQYTAERRPHEPSASVIYRRLGGGWQHCAQVAGLRHHRPTRDDLLAAAREYAAEHGALPDEQTWHRWLALKGYALVGRHQDWFGNMAGLAQAAGVPYAPKTPTPQSRPRRVQGMERDAYVQHHLRRLLETAERLTLGREL